MGAPSRRIAITALALTALLVSGLVAGSDGARGAARGRPGTADPTFGGGGKVIAKAPPDEVETEFGAVAREPGGNLVLALQTHLLTERKVTAVEMRSPSGALVRSFGTDGRVSVEDGGTLTPTADGDILVAVRRCDGEPGSVEMLDRRGARVASFGKDGCGPAIGFEAESIDIDGNGSLLLAGGVGYCDLCGKDASYSFETRLARLLPDGGLDPSFGEAGVLLTRGLTNAERDRLFAELGYSQGLPRAISEKSIRAALQLPHGIDVEATATTPAGDTFALVNERRGPDCRPCTPIPFLAKLTATGRLDRSYGRRGLARLPTPREGFFSTTLFPRSLLVAKNGSALVVGRVGDGNAAAIARAPSGAPNRRFAAGGLLLLRRKEPALLEATGLTIGSRGELIAAAQRSNAPGVRSGFAVAFGPDGRQRPGPLGTGGVETLTRGEIEPDGPGRIVGWGGNREDRALLASRRDGRRVKTYGHNGSARMPKGFVPESIAPAPGGGVAVFGSLSFHGIAVFQVGPNGHPLPDFGHEGLATLGHTESESGANAGLVEADGDIVLTGYRGGAIAARLLPDGRPDPTYGRRGEVVGLDPDGFGEQIAPLDGGVVIANGARGRPGDVGARLIRLDSRGRPVRAFGQDGRVFGPAENGPLALFAGDGRIVTVTDPHFEPDHKERTGIELWAYRPDGSIDRSFGDRGHLLYASGGKEGTSLVPAAAVQQPAGQVVVAATQELRRRTKLVLVRFR